MFRRPNPNFVCEWRSGNLTCRSRDPPRLTKSPSLKRVEVCSDRSEELEDKGGDFESVSRAGIEQSRHDPALEELAINDILRFFDWQDGKNFFANALVSFAGSFDEMQLVEQVQVPLSSELSNLCRHAKNLWNHANWLIRMRYHFILDPKRVNVKGISGHVKQKLLDAPILDKEGRYAWKSRASIEQERKQITRGKVDYYGKPSGQGGYHGTARQLYYNELDALLKHSRHYRALPSQSAQQVLKYLTKAWKGYFKAVKEWNNDPSKFPSGRRPRPPGFQKKEGHFVVVFTNQKCRIINEKLQFQRKVKYFADLKSPQEREIWNKYQSEGIAALTEEERYIHDTILFRGREKGHFRTLNESWFENEEWLKKLRLRPHIQHLNQVRIVPKGSCYVIEIVYTVRKEQIPLDQYRIAGIDIGMDNLSAIVNNIGLPPMLIRGGAIKSINQYANKQVAELRSQLSFGVTPKKGKCIEDTMQIKRIWRKRHNKLQKLFHKASLIIIDFCAQNGIGSLIIGYNEPWKTNVKVSKKFRREFVPIPFLKFIKQLEYKAALYGINVVRTEESYTSKTCAICGEQHEKSQRRGHKSGRVHRGLYACPKHHKLINSDINGAINIIKKVAPKAFKGIYPLRYEDSEVNHLLRPPVVVRLPYSQCGYSRA